MGEARLEKHGVVAWVEGKGQVRSEVPWPSGTTARLGHVVFLPVGSQVCWKVKCRSGIEVEIARWGDYEPACTEWSELGFLSIEGKVRLVK